MTWWPWRRRRSTAQPAAVWTAGGQPTVAPEAEANAPPAEATGPPCGWAVSLTDAAGNRIVRGAADACCTWGLSVVDLDPVPAPSTHDEETVCWYGGATRVTSGRATTPLHRLAEHRRTELGPGRVVAALERSRRADEVVVTTGPGDADPTMADGAHARAAAVWAHHLDDLHDRGAHPAPTADPAPIVVEAGRRVAVRLRPDVSCDGAPDHLDVVASCETSLTTTREATGPVPTAPSLAAWVEVAGKLAVADTPTGPVVTTPDMVWERLSEGGAAGVAVRSVPVGDHAVGWRGTLDVSVWAGEVTVVVGHAIHLEAAGGHATEGRVRAEAATATRLRLALAAPREHTCPCGTAELVVEVGDGGVALRVDGQELPVTPG